MFKNMTTVTQGSVGLGAAISYFLSESYVVSVPINDNQKYDLVVDNNNGLKKVQVKTTSYKTKNSKWYTVELKSTRSNRTKTNINYFDNCSCDYVFIMTEEKVFYLIPSKEIKSKTTLALNQELDKWIV